MASRERTSRVRRSRSVPEGRPPAVRPGVLFLPVHRREDQERLEQAWEEFHIEIPLEIVYSPYRELTRPILRYIDELDARWENDVITVLLPEFVVRHWWGNVLHNQTALLLKGRLLFRKGTVVTSLPYHLE